MIDFILGEEITPISLNEFKPRCYSDVVLQKSVLERCDGCKCTYLGNNGNYITVQYVDTYNCTRKFCCFPFRFKKVIQFIDD